MININFKSKVTIVFIIFILKYFFVLYLSHISDCNSTWTFIDLASYIGDADSYIKPIDNLLEYGTYSYYDNGKELFAGRMPYYGLLYIPFKILFNKAIAINVLVFVQLLVESTSVLYLGMILLILYKNIYLFYMGISIYAISLFTTYWSIYILPESFSISFLIFSFYNLTNYFKTMNKNNLLISIGFLVWVILLKPYFILFLIIFPLIIFYYHIKLTGQLKKALVYSIYSLKYILIFSFILLGPWIVRNYIAFNKFIPLQVNITAGVNYSASEMKLRELIQSWGESIIFWDKRSAACYFYNTEPCEYKLPPYVFTNNYSIDDLNNIRDSFQILKNNYDKDLDAYLSQRIDQLIKDFQSEKPMHYHIFARFILVKGFLIHSGSYYLPISKLKSCYEPWHLILKLTQSLLYYLALILGFMGLFLMIKVNHINVIYITIPLYLILLLSIILRLTEFRYFLHAYPFLIIGLSYFLYTIFIRIKLLTSKF